MLSSLNIKCHTFKGFPEAVDNLEPVIKRMLGLGHNERIILLNNGPSLRMPKDNPLKPRILQMFSTDFTSVSPEAIVRGILGGNLDILVLKGGLDGRDVEIYWGDHYVHFAGVVFQAVDCVVDQGD